MSDSLYNLQYSLFGYPNIVLPLLGGIGTDWIGFR